MSSLIGQWASVAAICSALLAGLLMTLTGQSFVTIAWRSAVTGTVVYLFASIGGQWAGRAVLRQLAEAEVEREGETRAKAESEETPAQAA